MLNRSSIIAKVMMDDMSAYTKRGGFVLYFLAHYMKYIFLLVKIT